ncbi:MAG: taurine dioxygenase [Acidimicrobiales bacterium]|jgi:taurine dioxygenase
MSMLTAESRTDLNTVIGTELAQTDLLSLDDEGVESVAQLVAERGVLFFRNQTMSLTQQVEFGARLGELHIHPAAKAPDGFPEVLLVHTDENSTYTAGGLWHTDVSCDARPPGLSMLRIEETPPTGGDTMWASMYQAFETLSTPMQQFLLTLTAEHRGDRAYQGRYSAADTKTDYPVSEHPVVRTHPRTGRKALYVNSGFTDRIKGLKSRESDALLSMLYDHIAYGVRFQVRFHWEPNSVAIWDNRCVQHHASWDYFPETRHGYRVTTRGEAPYLQL